GRPDALAIPRLLQNIGGTGRGSVPGYNGPIWPARTPPWVRCWATTKPSSSASVSCFLRPLRTGSSTAGMILTVVKRTAPSGGCLVCIHNICLTRSNLFGQPQPPTRRKFRNSTNRHQAEIGVTSLVDDLRHLGCVKE